MNIIKRKRVGMVVIILASNFILSFQSLVNAQEQNFTGSRKDITGYVQIRVNQIVGEEGGLSLQTRIEKYPVLLADFGTRCEFFLKNPKKDITQGSQLAERVYFKDVTRIQAFRGIPVNSDQYGVNIYVGNKRYQIRKWSGMASLAEHIHGGDCSKINQNDLSYDWPALHFKVITDRNTVQWLEADLTNIVEFANSKEKGSILYNEISKNAKKEAPAIPTPSKSFQKLKEEARQKAERSAVERKQKRMENAAQQQLKEGVAVYRANVSEGDDSHCGLIIEVKEKVIKVQSPVGEYWLKRNQLYPPDVKPCNFMNGVYQEP